MNFNRQQRFSIRKLSVGVASVFLGMALVFAGQGTVAADDAVGNEALTNTPALAQPSGDQDRTAPKAETVDKNANAVSDESENKVTEANQLKVRVKRADTVNDALIAKEGPTNYNKSGLGNNPANGHISDKSDVFGEQDFSNETVKEKTRKDQAPAANSTEKLGEVTYKWKEKVISKGTSVDGWEILEGDSVTLVKPETPTAATSRPAGAPLIASKIYDNGGNIKYYDNNPSVAFVEDKDGKHYQN